MKSIKEKASIYLKEEEDEVVCVYDRYAGFVDGANYVLEQIENFMKDSDLGNSAEEKFYKLDVLADIGLFIEQLKK